MPTARNGTAIRFGAGIRSRPCSGHSTRRFPDPSAHKNTLHSGITIAVSLLRESAARHRCDSATSSVWQPTNKRRRHSRVAIESADSRIRAKMMAFVGVLLGGLQGGLGLLRSIAQGEITGPTTSTTGWRVASRRAELYTARPKRQSA